MSLLPKNVGPSTCNVIWELTLQDGILQITVMYILICKGIVMLRNALSQTTAFLLSALVHFILPRW